MNLHRLFIVNAGDCVPMLFLKLYISGDRWCFSLPQFWSLNWWIYHFRYGSFRKPAFMRIFSIPCWYLCFGVPIWYHKSVKTPMNYDFGYQRGPAVRVLRGLIGPFKHRRDIRTVLLPVGRQELLLSTSG